MTVHLARHKLQLNLCSQIKVFTRDVREAAEVGAGANRVGQYELHDLVLIEWVSAL